MIGPSDVLLFGTINSGGRAGTPGGVAVDSSGHLLVSTSSGSADSDLFAFDGTSFVELNVTSSNPTYGFFSSVITAGSVAVWTPSFNPRFRLLGYTISIAGTVSATGIQQIIIKDEHPDFSSVIIAQHFATVSSTPVGDTQIGAALDNGYLSTADGSTLTVSISLPMLTGGVAVNVWGHEEGP